MTHTSVQCWHMLSSVFAKQHRKMKLSSLVSLILGLCVCACCKEMPLRTRQASGAVRKQFPRAVGRAPESKHATILFALQHCPASNDICPDVCAVTAPFQNACVRTIRALAWSNKRNAEPTGTTISSPSLTTLIDSGRQSSPVDVLTVILAVSCSEQQRASPVRARPSSRWSSIVARYPLSGPIRSRSHIHRC